MHTNKIHYENTYIYSYLCLMTQTVKLKKKNLKSVKHVI